MNPNDLGVPDVEGFDYSWNMDAELFLDEIADQPLDFADARASRSLFALW